MTRARSAFAIAAALSLSLSACGKEKEDSSSSSGDGDGSGEPSGEKAPEKKPIETLLTGKAPTLPAEFKGVGPGSSLEEAKKLLPGLPKDSMFDGAYAGDPSFRVYVPKKKTKVLLVSVSLPKAGALDLVKKAWGEPTMTTELDKPVPAWFNPEAGLRAKLSPGFGDNDSIEFTTYIPYEKLLGAEGKAFAFAAPKDLLGASVDDLRAAYAKEIVEKDAAQAKKDRADLQKFAGDKVKMLGKAKPSVRLDFPPTEYGSYETRVHLMFNDEAKVYRYWFGIDFRSRPEAKDEILAFLKKKLGEPKEGKDLGRPVLIFGEKPSIVLKEDTISNKWDITVEAGK